MPLFYTRSSDGLPRGWLRMMKRSITHAAARCSTPAAWWRSTSTTCYVPSAQRFLRLAGDNLKRAAELAAVAARPDARLAAGPRRGGRVERRPTRCTSGPSCSVKARVNLGGLKPDDVEVQLFHGLVDSLGEIPQPQHGADVAQRPARRRLDLGVHGARSRAVAAASTATRCAFCRGTPTWPIRSSRGW